MPTIIALEAEKIEAQGKFKAVVVDESKNGLRLKSAALITKQDAEKYHRTADIRITCFYDGVVNATVEIPPIKNETSRTLLFKNKMKDSLKLNEEYSLIYFENPDIAVYPKMSYTVYAAPENVLFDVIKADKRSIKMISSFTFNFFSLMGISDKFDPESTIFHAYGDKRRITIVVSCGRKLEYTRSSEVPENITSEEELTNFYYENINLTYLYVRQSFSGVKMKILLSGSLFFNAALTESVERFMDQPVSHIDTDKIIAGASLTQFHEFMIPIGAALIKDSFDFSSKVLKENRFIDKILKYANSTMIVIVAMLAVIFINKWNTFDTKRIDFENRSMNLLIQETKLINKIGQPSLLKSGNDYLNIIRAKTDNPLSLLAGVQNLLDFYKFSSISFIGKGANAKVNIVAEEPQRDFLSLEDFRKSINEKITEAEKKSLITQDDSIHTLKELRNRINVVVSPRAKDQNGQDN